MWNSGNQGRKGFSFLPGFMISTFPCLVRGGASLHNSMTPHRRFRVFTIAAALAFLPARGADRGWVTLGQPLDNWVVRGGTAQYRIEDNVIIGRTVDSVDQGTQTFLCT